jgi:hypothetical protein
MTPARLMPSIEMTRFRAEEVLIPAVSAELRGKRRLIAKSTIARSQCKAKAARRVAAARSQPCFTIGHALSLSGRAASSAATVASSLR